jgi:tetratricopeptide (TPR) repeat protein
MRLTLLALLLAGSLTAQERLGTLDFPNSGKPEAQTAFVRGVALLHNFAYADAAKAFVEAQSLDPHFVLAYWGEAMTYNHPIWMEVSLDNGRKALAKLTDHTLGTARERQYVDAVSILYGSEPDKPTRDAAYERAMAKLADAWPDDVEAQVFHALSILGTMRRGEPDARKQIRAAALLEPLLPTHPDHPGVLHYLIHAYDDPIHAPLGLRAARRYAGVAAAAPHALHMPSHIFVQLGMWPEVAHQNEQAWAVSGKKDFHSLEWLQYAYLQLGRRDDAKRLLSEISGDSERAMHARDHMRVRYSVETGDWDAFDFAAAHPSKETVFARGMQALARAKLDDAMKASKELGAMTPSDDVDKSLLAVLRGEIDSSVAAARGNRDEALTLLRSAAAAEELLGAPSGPPDSFKPALEAYGEALLRAGRKQEAAAEFRASLLRTPNRSPSVAGLAAAEKP